MSAQDIIRPFRRILPDSLYITLLSFSRTDFIEGFNFTHIEGREIMGPPMEVYASRRQMNWMREGVRKAGRPGLAVVYYPINEGGGPYWGDRSRQRTSTH